MVKHKDSAEREKRESGSIRMFRPGDSGFGSDASDFETEKHEKT